MLALRGGDHDELNDDASQGYDEHNLPYLKDFVGQVWEVGQDCEEDDPNMDYKPTKGGGRPCTTKKETPAAPKIAKTKRTTNNKRNRSTSTGARQAAAVAGGCEARCRARAGAAKGGGQASK